MFEPIHNRQRAKQLVSFEGMELGERLWPTDFDAVIEWQDRAWIVFEVKHGGKGVPFGQRLALQRFVADAWMAGKRVVAAIMEHHVSDPSEDIYLAERRVRELYLGGEFEWREPKRPMTAKELVDSYTGYVDGMSA